MRLSGMSKMKVTTFILSVLLSVVYVNCNPIAETNFLEDEDIKLTLSKTNFFIDKKIVFRGNNTITNLVPLFHEDLLKNESTSGEAQEFKVFFNQVETNADGSQNELGQFVLVNGTAQKIFDGRCSSNRIGSNDVYFGAKDGLYIYNNNNNTATPLGIVKDNIAQIQVANGADFIYYLTEPDNRIYRVNFTGENKTLIEAIPSAREFVLDRENNIYFYGDDKVPHVLTADEDRPIEFPFSVPVEHGMLLRPPNVADEGVLFVVDSGDVYILHSNGTSEPTPFVFGLKPTSVSMDAAVLQYYAVEGNIYEYNFVVMLLEAMTGIIDQFFEQLKEKAKTFVSDRYY